MKRISIKQKENEEKLLFYYSKGNGARINENRR